MMNLHFHRGLGLSGAVPVPSMENGLRGARVMVSAGEDQLLPAVIWNQLHVLHGIFPPTIKCHCMLHPGSHYIVLPVKDNRNFIPRIMYKAIPYSTLYVIPLSTFSPLITC